MNTLGLTAVPAALFTDLRDGLKTFWSGIGTGFSNAAFDPQSTWFAAIWLLVAGLVALIVFNYKTRTGIIARATTKEAVRQPIFILLLAICAAFLCLNTFLPFFSLGEDLKMLKDVGLVTLLVSGMFLAVWTSSTTISEEIDGKTAMTLLSKPINRRQFILGKYIGILDAVLFLLVPLSVIFLMLVFYKVGYDAKESSKSSLEAAQRMGEVFQTIPGILLIVLEVTIMTAISVAIATRVPMIVNIVSCFAIFVVGHLTPVLVRTVFQDLEFVKFMAQLIATIMPSLDLFNASAAVATGKVIPPNFVGLASLYCAAYCTAATLLAFVLFEDRDLA